MEEDTRTIRGGSARAPRGGNPSPGLVILFTEGTLHTTGIYRGRQETSIGRHPGQLVFVEDPGLSRRHAMLRFDGQGVRLIDLRSHNGTYLNRVKVEGEVPVRYGDLIRCGNTLGLVVADVEAFTGWPETAEDGPLLGGPTMEQVRRKLKILASRECVVLVTGDSGTGKEVAARELHNLSRRVGPFVPVNCAAVPESLFEAELFGARRGAFTGASSHRGGLRQAASGGTLFLDEIGELPLSMQPKLLRAVELGEVRALGSSSTVRIDFRLVVATNRDLEQEVETGAFRADLFHRVCGAAVQIPPLRRRREDVLIFARRALERASDEEQIRFDFSASFLERLFLHPWPGNVRELERTVSEAVMQATLDGHEQLLVSHLQPGILSGKGPDQQLARLRQAMLRTGGVVSQAAADLGIQRSQIYNLLRAHGLRAEDFR